MPRRSDSKTPTQVDEGVKRSDTDRAGVAQRRISGAPAVGRSAAIIFRVLQLLLV
jgi:hypothetical protein